jgi:surface protein
MKQGGGDVPPTASASSGVKKFLDRRLAHGGLPGTDYANDFEPSSLRKAEVVGDVEKQGHDMSLVVSNAIAAESVHTSVDVSHSVPRHLEAISFTDANIDGAVDEWITDPDAASTKYGNITTWDVSGVTNMEYLFNKGSEFNEDISKWDVSSVTNMRNMFVYASVFNQDISEWDVSSVTRMNWMFAVATEFNQDISKWDVSSVTDMENMFYSASAFDQELCAWDSDLVSTTSCNTCMICTSTPGVGGDPHCKCCL